MKFQASDSPPCLYCQSTEYGPGLEGVTDRLGMAKGVWRFLRCCRCGSATLSPFPKAEEIASFYPKTYCFALEPRESGALKSFWSQIEYQLFYRLQYETQVKRVLRTIGTPPGSAPLRMHDVGCGRGLRLISFQKRGWNVEGSDVTADSVQYVQERLGISAIVSNSESLVNHYPPGTFDLITGFHVYEHVLDVTRALAVAFSLLKPGGWLMAGLPFFDSPLVKLMGTRSVIVSEAPRHVSLPSFEGARLVFRAVGFEEISICPDSLLHMAGTIGLSLIPGSATTHLYGNDRLKALMNHLLGAGMTLAALPISWFESYVLNHPSLGLIFGRKPLGKT